MNIAIVDDVEVCLSDAKMHIERFYNNKGRSVQLDLYKNGEEYIESKKKYDISFVDIDMGDGIDGFNTIKKAREYNSQGIYIVLTTQVESWEKGFQVAAYRYIDKKKMKERIVEALSSIEVLFRKKEKISLNIIGEGKQEITLENIFFIETEKRYLLIHTKHGVKRCSDNISELEETLRGKWFYRCHKSFIVNLDEIKHVDDSIIYMNSGEDLDISKRKIQDFKKVYLKRMYECANA